MDVNDLIQIRQRVKNLRKSKKYSDALSLVINTLKKVPYFLPLLIDKVALMQLQEDSGPLTHLNSKEYYREIRVTLELAIRLDKNSIVALTEFGYYFLVHEDNSKLAKKIFSDAIEKAKEQYLEAYIGLIKSHHDNHEYKKAKQFLRKAKKVFGNSPALEDVEENISY